MRFLIIASLLTVSTNSEAQHPASSETTATARYDTALAAFFDEYDKAVLEIAPYSKTTRGIVDADYGRWGDFSDLSARKRQALDQVTLAALHARFDRDALSEGGRLNYDLFENLAARNAAAFNYRRNGYLFDQMNGLHTRLPSFLIGSHRITDHATAEHYISRLNGLAPALDQLMVEAEQRAAAGVLPPRWVFPYVIRDAQNVIAGAPFDDGPDSALFADLKKKVAALDLSTDEKSSLVESGRTALVEQVGPAYDRLIALMRRHESRAGNHDGVWRFPEGRHYYAERLSYFTTTSLTADEIHVLGLKEVARIQAEMIAIKQKVGFKGSLQDFFKYTRNDPKFFHATRGDYLADLQARQEAVEAILPRWFGTLPKGAMIVKEVEPFREKSATKAWYESPAPDGSRPGTYYINLYDLKAVSKNELEALFYHEGVPGHHLERSLQIGLADLPAFRRFGLYNAYAEGWGLYAERLAKDMGFYTDPYSDLGRLSMDILRAGRLVVDTGIHHKRWTREQAVAWFKENTPVTEGDIQNQVDRYIVYPGQATSYTIGKLKIEELRARSEAALSDRFDIREFHDVILLSGSLPLDVLERNVDQWIQRSSLR